MLPHGGRVAVALSGGPDSVALVHLLLELQAEGYVTVAGLAHFNHHLRGDASDGDERFCRAFADALGLPLEVGRADVRVIASEERRSIEDTARRLRYDFLRGAAIELGAEAIAIAHSRDDQAETFLLRILRGAGTRGLGGIRPVAGPVIRPLLDISRAELRQFAAERGLSCRDDESNRDLTIPRNRIRLELLPYLEREFSPRITEVLAREAALAQTDEDRLELEAIDLARSIVLVNAASQSDAGADEDSSSTVVVDARALRSLHPALGSRVARKALEPLARGRFIGFDQVGSLLDLAIEGREGAALSLPAQQARVVGDRIVLGPEPPRGGTEAANTFEIPLSIPGEVVLGPQRMAVSAEWATAEVQTPALGVWTFVRGVAEPLVVRSRRPGDRFQPPGMGGRSRKLQDYLVDRKIVRGSRDELPLVVDGNDRIVWVVGHGVSEVFRATEPSAGVILLKARRLGGEG